MFILLLMIGNDFGNDNYLKHLYCTSDINLLHSHIKVHQQYPLTRLVMNINVAIQLVDQITDMY